MMGNPNLNSVANPPQRAYSDNPDRDDLASTSSAVLMSDIEYPVEETPLTEGFPEDELPAYSDVPQLPQPTPSEPPISYLIPPPLPQSCLSSDQTTTMCHFQRYSQDPVILEAMVREQAAYPPNIALRLQGTHTETFKTRDGKKETKRITDFDIRVNMTHLLVCPNPGHARDVRPCDVHPHPRARPQDPPQEVPTPSCKYIKLLGAGEEGYRGKVFKSLEPPDDAEASPSLSSWCNAYVSDPHTVKTFTFERQVLYHNTARLETLCRDLVQKTSYRGHTSITFETTHKKVIVFSPCKINSWRNSSIIFWLCIITFLWIFTWPILFFCTKRYEVVTAVFPYRLDPERNRVAKPLVQTEDGFFDEWKQALARAVLAQHQGWVDGIYKEETAQMARVGNAMMTVQSPQNNIGGFMAGAVRVALGIPAATGWGADS